MTDDANVPGEKALIAAYNSGALINDIFDRFDHLDQPDLDTVLSTCVELHNSGKINLPSLVESPFLETTGGHSFFTGQRFFCKAIPKIKCSTMEMMRCVQALVEKGGDDGFAHLPNDAFQEWCKADLKRVHEIVEAAKNTDPLAIRFLSFSLIAGNRSNEARSFVEEYSDQRRLSGITALGSIQFNTPNQAREALSTLLSALDDQPDDELRANILLSALDIVKNSDQIIFDDILDIVKRVCDAPGSKLHFCCARALWLHAQTMSEDVLTLLLQPLYSIDPTHKGTIRELDNGLRSLLATSHADHAISFVEKLLSSSDNVVSLSEFESFSRQLVQEPDERFHRVFIAWLLSGEFTLCDGLSVILGDPQHREKPVNLPFQDFVLSPTEQIFLCRKAIGFFFWQPVIAGSILVSVLRICDDSVAEQVCSMLFDPLLLNYGGDLKDYLDTIEPSHPAHQHILSDVSAYGTN